jgi:DNA mismatch repair ATPase MutS
VELEETKRITEQSTPESLVIIDELGRGTSTFDGMAIASAVLKFIVKEIGCFTLFSTHYFPITEEYQNNEAVKL